MAKSTTDDSAKPPELSTMGILEGAAMGAAAGAAVNVFLFAVAGAAGISRVAELVKGEPPVELGVVQVMVSSFMPAVAVALFTLVLNRFTARPGRILIGVATALALVSLGAPLFGLGGASAGLRGVLASMHLVSAAAIVGGVLRYGRARPPSY